MQSCQISLFCNKQLAEKRQVHLWSLFTENSFEGQFIRDKQSSHFMVLDFCECSVRKWKASECANNRSCFQPLKCVMNEVK